MHVLAPPPSQGICRVRRSCWLAWGLTMPALPVSSNNLQHLTSSIKSSHVATQQSLHDGWQ